MKFFFEIQKFNSLNLLKYSKKNNSFFLINLLNNDYKTIKLFINQITTNNKKYNYLKILFSFFFFFFNYLKKKNNWKNYNYFFEINSSLNNNLYLNNPVFLFSWYLNYFFFLFQIKKNKIKNKQNAKAYSLTFLKKSKRRIYFFKLIKSSFFLNKNKKFIIHYYDILLDSFLNLKTSNLYKNKILIYKKFLSN